MKKILIFGVMIGILIGALSFVLAAEQGLTVTIGEDIHLLITPNPLGFGPVVPGINNNPATNGPIQFDASGSNVDVKIEVTAVTGFPFESNGLLLGGAAPVGQTWNLLCTPVGSVCTYVVASTIPTLNVPLGATKGDKAGTITYLITGPPL